MSLCPAEVYNTAIGSQFLCVFIEHFVFIGVFFLNADSVYEVM